MADLLRKQRAQPVQLTDETNEHKISTEGDAQVVDSPQTAGAFKNIVVGITAVEVMVGGVVLAGRKYVILQVKDNDVYYGFDNTVSETNGTQVFKNQILFIPVGPLTKVWVIGNLAGRDLRIGEL